MRVSRVQILKAARIVKKGGLVGFPTETVYGIAADPLNKKTVSRLNKIKGRPKGKPYTLHIAYKKDIYKFVPKLSAFAKRIIKKYLPGPVTVILEDRKGRKIGFRMPDNKIALALIRAVGSPIIAPSANISGKKSPVRAEDVCSGLDFVLGGGHTKYRMDSTIIDLTVSPAKIIRQGCVKILPAFAESHGCKAVDECEERVKEESGEDKEQDAIIKPQIGGAGEYKTY